MIGLDTNLLLRYFLDDDPVQSPKARRMMKSLSEVEPGWVTLAAVLEFVWVLKSKNRAQRMGIATTLDRLLALDAVAVREQAEVLAEAVRRFTLSKADFADCLIAASSP